MQLLQSVLRSYGWIRALTVGYMNFLPLMVASLTKAKLRKCVSVLSGLTSITSKLISSECALDDKFETGTHFSFGQFG